MPNHDIRIQLDIKIPMRDGIQLYGALYRPAVGDKFPVLLIRSPYSTQHPRYVDWAVRFAQSGYAVVMQDSRGRYDSEGVWRPYIDETNDGYDTQQWLGAQPWCDGNIGTFGISYPGFTQILPAALRSPYVKGLVPIANQEDNYGHMRYNGVLQLQNAMNFIWLGDRTNQNAPRDLIDWEEVYRRLPLISALDSIGDRPFYREVIRHNAFDDFWKSYSMKYRYTDVETPAYFITGWYDNLVHEGFKCFTGWTTHARTSETRSKTKLLVGPWTHTAIGSAEPFGDVDFGSNAMVDIPDAHHPLVRSTAKRNRHRHRRRTTYPNLRDGSEYLAPRARMAPCADAIHQVLPTQRRTRQLSPRRWRAYDSTATKRTNRFLHL